MPVIPKPIPELTLADIKRFWEHVDQTGGSDKCWNWKLISGRPTPEHLYPNFQVCVNGKWVSVKPSRLAYFLGTGKDLGAAFGCHSCDNRRCCNFNHIFPGTNRDNMADAAQKGRMPNGDEHYARRRPELVTRGERKGNAFLTTEIVRSIYVASGTRREIAHRFAVNAHHVDDIKRRRRWGHVTDDLVVVWPAIEKPGRRVGDPWRKVS